MAAFMLYFTTIKKQRKKAIKRNELLTTYAINILIKDILKYTVLSKRSQIQRSTYCTIPTGPLQKKYATPGTLNPDTSQAKKDKYNL